MFTVIIIVMLCAFI